MKEGWAQLATLLGAAFTWSEQSGSYTITYETRDNITTKIWIAGEWINHTPLKCVSVAVNSESLSLIFEKPQTEKKEVA
jgi:hypothetical protein